MRAAKTSTTINYGMALQQGLREDMEDYAVVVPGNLDRGEYLFAGERSYLPACLSSSKPRRSPAGARGDGITPERWELWSYVWLWQACSMGMVVARVQTT
jgi:hypothetical protein